MAKRSLSQKRTHYTPRSAGSAASKFGQMIGTAFECVVIEMIAAYLAEKYPDYEIAQATGRKIAGLDMFGGKARKVDNTIIPVNSDDPIALLETKWLKDGRHHNDKGAWILQLREIRKQYPSIRGTGAILIGFWTNDVVVFLMSEGQVKAVRIATDKQVYASLQTYLDAYLDSHDLDPLVLNAQQIRDKYERAWDLANCIQWMDEQATLLPLVEQWLLYKHPEEPQPGLQKIQKILDGFLQQPDTPKTEQWAVIARIDSGNLIYEEFDDPEDAHEFIRRYSDPENILKRITPRKRQDED